MFYKNIKYVIINDNKLPINKISLSVYSIFFGGLEKVATKKFVIYLNNPKIDNTNKNVVI